MRNRYKTWLLVLFAIVLVVFTVMQLSRLKPSAPNMADVVATVDAKSKIVENSTERVTATMYVKRGLPEMFVKEIQKRGITGQINKSDTLFIRAELSAPGVEIGGKTIQDKALDRMAIPFVWDCRFKDPGPYTLRVNFSTIGPSGMIMDVGEAMSRVQVTSPGGFTQTWLWVGGMVAGLIAIVVSVLTIIGFFRKKESAPAIGTDRVVELRTRLSDQLTNGAPKPPVEVSSPSITSGVGGDDLGES
jgi:hypothetical protein